MTKFSSFFYAALILLLFCTCDNTVYYTQPTENGLLIAFECTHPKMPSVLITEADIDSVDWEQQKYYLRNDSIANMNVKEISMHLCSRACQVGFYLDHNPLFAIPILSGHSPKDLPIYQDKVFWACPCESMYYDCILDSINLSLLPLAASHTIQILKNEQIKQRLASIGKLR
jgi:hypothetical protein